MNTSRLASKRAANHRQNPRRPSSRSEAILDFFERPAPGQTRDRPSDGRRRDRHRAVVGLLERLAVLGQRQIVVVLEMGGQPPFEQGPLHRGPARDGLGIDVASLSAALEPALDGRYRHREGTRHLFPWRPAIHGGEHPEPEILRVRFHPPSLALDQHLR